MTQRRAVYPSAATSLSLARCSVEAQLLFTRLIAAADDQGRLQGDPLLVKAQCVPLIDRATPKRIDEWLAELHDSGMILRYESAGQSLIQVVKWWDYQGWLRHLFPSRWPAPEGYEDRTKGHGAADGLPPSDGHSSANGRTPDGLDVDVSGEVEVDLANDVDVEPAIEAIGPPTEIANHSLTRTLTTHFDLTGVRCSPGGEVMYRDLIQKFGYEVVRRAQWNVGAQDKTDRGFIGRVKTQCKRLAA